MKVTFTSGAWIEMRGAHELTAKDKMKMQAATILPGVSLEGNGVSAPLTLDMVSRQMYAVLDRVISAWSYEWPVPKDDISSDEEGHRTWEGSLQNLPLDDWNELEEAVEPHMEKMRGGPKGRGGTLSTSNGLSKAGLQSSRRASPRKS